MNATLHRFGLILLCGIPSLLTAQGPPGPPSGPPGDTMKSLQEIWDHLQTNQAQNVVAHQSTWAKLAALEEQHTAILERLDSIMTRLDSVAIEWVTVGNSGNSSDPETGTGGVAYEYRIGRYEVTNEQYAEFLNAVAGSDTYDLYRVEMGTDPRGGITRLGSPGAYTYAVKEHMGKKPVNYVSWYDAARFCNWLHNGQLRRPQGEATTEDGAYTLTGAEGVALGSDPDHGVNGRNEGARYWIPGEHEWYKAAYHEPGGDTDGYWLYPTRSNDAPTVATCDAAGNINNDVANIANYDLGADWNGQNGNVTTVGSGGTGSQSFYGASDMGGNVYEWGEHRFGYGERRLRGGNYAANSSWMQSTAYSSSTPDNDWNSSVGFRLAAP